MKSKSISLKRILTFVLSVSTIALILPACANSTESKEATKDTADYEYTFRNVAEKKYIDPSTAFAGGDGSESNPYQISNAGELAYFANLCNSADDEKENRDYVKANYLLTNDIQLNDTSDFESWSTNPPEYSWQSISEGKLYYFEGVFDGDGHTIYGMYIDEDANSNDDLHTSSDGYGLFGKNNGTIKNLNIENAYVCVSGYMRNVGVVVGNNILDNSKVISCNTTATVICYDAEGGGVVGNNNGEISDCSFAGKIIDDKDLSFSHIGGIVGNNSGKVDSCTNNGEVLSGSESAESVGGIAGYIGEGEIVNSTNNGNVSGGTYTGGISGDMYISNIGGEYVSKGVKVDNCSNNGTIENTNDSIKTGAGGITGCISNDKSEYSIDITNCENNGNIKCDKEVAAGIAATAYCDGSNLKIENCNNNAEVSSKTAGGVIGNANVYMGTIEFSSCSNSGNIISTQYTGGIVSNVMILKSSDKDLNLTIDNCKNEGELKVAVNGGGIVGIFNDDAVTNKSGVISVEVSNSVNTGNITSDNINGFIGGIVGGCGLSNTDTTIANCGNSGNLTYNETEVDEETTEIEESKLELRRMAGGIVGRVGEVLYLSTTSDKKAADTINDENAKIKIQNCYNSCSFEAPDENEYVYKNDNTAVVQNDIGAIVGNASGDDGYAFLCENCKYAKADKGLGSNDYNTDIGTKADETEIEKQISSIVK